MSNKHTTLTFNDSELETIYHALRFWRGEGCQMSAGDCGRLTFVNVPELTDVQVTALIERVNCSEDSRYGH